MKVTTFQSSEPTWKSFLSLARTRCCISVHPVAKRSSTKRLEISAKDFPVAGLAAIGSSIFSYAASTSVRTRGLFEMLPVSFHCENLFCFQVRSRDCIEYNTKQHRSARVGTMPQQQQCFVKDIPPASGGINHAVCRFLQSCSNVKRMTCFWWQLTHNVTVHITRLSLKKSCFEINMKKIPSLTGCHLTTHSKSESCGSRGISLSVFSLFILETS